MSATTAPFGLRMPSPLRTLVEHGAAANRRSMNSEIIFRLEQSYQSEEKGAAEGATSPRHEHAETVEGMGNDYSDQ
jgi:hypothetical protein